MAEHRARGPVSSGLAQRVVDLVAPTISQNVNVMDEHGTIVASLDPERIGTLHHGAQRALAEGRTVLVTTPEPGTTDRPGANEPLVVDGRVVGVVGVTGDPREVAPLARVVALTVQLLIAQEHEHDAVTRRHTEARDLLAALSAGTTSVQGAADRLAAAGMAAGPWSLGVWADAAPRADGSASPPQLASALATRINTRPGHRAAVLHGALWIVSATSSPLDPPGVPRDSRRVLVAGVDDVGHLLSYAEDLRALCRYARLLPLTPDPRWTLEIAVATAHLPRRTLERLAATTDALTSDQRHTIAAVAGTSSMPAAAAALFVHRNTLLQRVRRIRDLTGLDLRRPDDLVTLRLALAAGEAMEPAET